MKNHHDDFSLISMIILRSLQCRPLLLVFFCPPTGRPVASSIPEPTAIRWPTLLP
jgi:hypothetical protein